MPHIHDDTIKWKHFPRYWPFVWGIHWWPVNSPHKGQWRRALIFWTRTNDWISNCDAGDLRRHRAHYDVTVMFAFFFSFIANVPLLVRHSKSQAQITLLTHLPLDKMATISDDIFRYIYRNWKFCILIRISLKIAPKGSIDNNPALVQVMAWCRTGDMLLHVSQAMLTQFIDAYMRHEREMS